MLFDWLTVLYTAITTMFAAMVNGIAGFGLAQVNMGVMPLFRDLASATIITSIVAIVCNFFVWRNVKDEFDYKALIYPVFGLIFGMPIGLSIFQNLNKKQVELMIGIIILIAVLTIIIGKKTKILNRLFEKFTKKIIIYLQY